MSLLSRLFGPRLATLLVFVDLFVHVLQAFLKDWRILAECDEAVARATIASGLHPLDSLKRLRLSICFCNNDIAQLGKRETGITKTDNNTELKDIAITKL